MSNIAQTILQTCMQHRQYSILFVEENKIAFKH